MRIAYRGIPGSYCQEALVKYYPDHELISCRSFTELRYACQNENADAIFLTLDNTISSNIKNAAILIEENSLHIASEVNFSVYHCLLAVPGIAIDKISTVISSPEALLQCKGIIEKAKWEPVEYWEPAESARAIAEEKMTSTAAIASRKCASIYKLNVLQEDIGDLKTNLIRFLMLQKEKYDGEIHKISFAFRLPHIQGSLSTFLGIISSHGLNLTKVESMPIPEEPYHFEFIAEVDVKDKRWRICMEELKLKAEKIKMLGSYEVKK